MKNFSILLFFALLFAVACKQNKPDTASASLGTSSEIPALLERNEAIRNGKEWDDVQNYYATQRKALSTNPDDHEAALKLAELFINEARVTGEHPHYYPAALQMVDPVITALGTTSDPRQKDLLFRALGAKSSVQLSLHDFSNALVTAQKAVAINPHNAQIYGALVDANVELGRYAAAVEMADKMVGIRPDLRSYSRVSYLREIHGDVPGAMEAMDMAIKAGYPGQESAAWARLTLGNLHQTYGDLKSAALQYQIILAERPDYPFAIAEMAALEIKQKNYPQAETLLQKACGIIPEVGFYEQLAEVYRATGRTAEYQALLPKIVTMMEEDNAKGHNMSLEFASFYSDIQPDLDKALTYALSEYQKRPDNIDVNRLLSKIYAKKGDSTKAQEHLAKASITKSVHPELLEIKKMLSI